MRVAWGLLRDGGMRHGRYARVAIALLVAIAFAAPAEASRVKRAKVERLDRSKKGDATGAKPTGKRRLHLGGLSLSRRTKRADTAAAEQVADAPRPEARPDAPRPAGKKAGGTGLAAKVRARWAKLPRAAKIGLAGLAVGGAIAGAWALPAALAVKVGVTVGIVALSGVGGFYARARGKIAGWQKSYAHGAVATIEEAAGRRDAGRLDQLEGELRTRQSSLASSIASARRLKSETLPDGTKVEDAQREHDFLGLAIARATLHETIHSADARSRVGQRTVDSWTKGIGELDSAAQASDFEGDLALELDALDAELAGEGRAADGLSERIDAYGKHVPRLFGGEMKKARDATRGLLEKFLTDEIGRERTLHAGTTGAMRGRVTRRLAARDRTFASHHDRLQRLSALAEETGEAQALAEDIDSELQSAINHRNQEQSYLAIAATKTAVPVTRTRPGANGQQETYQDVEDQSGIWKGLAYQEASSAAAAANRARSGLESLRPLVEKLRADKTLRNENLHQLLPERNSSTVLAGDSGLMSFIGPPLFNLLMGSGTNVRSVHSSFQYDLGSIRRVHGETSARQKTEHTWVETKVTADVDRQKAEARSRAK